MKDPKTDFRELVINMFKEYFPQLGLDQVLMGSKRVFIKLESLPYIIKRYEELVGYLYL